MIKKERKKTPVRKKEKHLLLSIKKKKTDNKSIKWVALKHKIEQQKSTWVDCDSKKSTF